ncbi:MAG: hypothetical protein HQK49_18490 [Oligoflexia bacterium]|nr:hypothetical protein [Oligoflexia bacterium]
MDELSEKLSEKLHTDLPELTNYIVELLSSYGWPGNVIELRSVLEKLILTL